MRLQLAVQYLKFGAIGSAATFVHVMAFILWVEVVGMAPLWANVAAFSIAFMVAFTGHFQWTFRAPGTGKPKRWEPALGKFIVVSLTGLALNSLSIYIVVDMLAMPYLYAVGLMVTVVPAFGFGLSKLWAFA